jgi:outer membrane receptor protein involved in Fe transport
MKMHLLKILAYLFASSVVTHAESAESRKLDALLAMPMDQLMAVDAQVESGAKTSQNTRELPQPITVLSASDIRAFGYRNLADVLNGLPGIYTSSDRTYSYLGARGMIASGSFNSRVLVTIDGMRINDNIYQQVGMAGHEFPIDIDLIDRVEFVPGPGSVAYGNNAFLGVVNVITRSAASREHGELAAATDSNGAWYKRGTAHIPVNGGHAMVSLSQLDAPGAAIFYPDSNASTDRNMDQDQNQKVFVKYERGPLYVNLISSDRTKTIPSQIAESQFNNPNTQYQDRWLIGNVGYQLMNTDNVEFRTRVHWGQYKFNGAYAMAAATDAYHEASEGNWWGVDLTGVWRGIEGHQISSGLQFQDNTRQWLYAKFDTQSTAVIDSARSTQTYALWLEDQFSLWHNGNITLGARLDQDMQQQTQLSPRVGIVQQLSSDDTFRINLAKNFLTPSDYELRYAGSSSTSFQAPNMLLKAESMTSLDIGWEHRGESIGRTMLSAFVYQADNLIELVDIPTGQAQHQNKGSATGQGVQLEWQRNWQDWRVTSSATLQSVNDDTASGKRVDSPASLYKMQLRAPRFWQIQPAIEALHFGERLTRDGDHLAAATLLNATLSRQMSKELTIRLSVFNAIDTQYSTPVSVDYPMAAVRQEGRVVRLKFEWNF